MPKQSEARLFRERIFSPLLRESVLPICILLPATFSRKVIRKSLAHGKGASPFASAYLSIFYRVNDFALTFPAFAARFLFIKIRALFRPCFVSRLAKTHGYWLRRLSRTNENVQDTSFTVLAFAARVGIESRTLSPHLRKRLANMHTIDCGVFAQNHPKISRSREGCFSLCFGISFTAL